jgi:hypothetical protein
MLALHCDASKPTPTSAPYPEIDRPCESAEPLAHLALRGLAPSFLGYAGWCVGSGQIRA